MYRYIFEKPTGMTNGDDTRHIGQALNHIKKQQKAIKTHKMNRFETSAERIYNCS